MAACGLDDIQSASVSIFRRLIVVCVCASSPASSSVSPLCQLVNQTAEEIRRRALFFFFFQRAFHVLSD